MLDCKQHDNGWVVYESETRTFVASGDSCELAWANAASSLHRLEQENADLQKRNREHRELLDDILHFSQRLEVSPDWWSVPVSEGLQERIVKMIG